MIYTGRVHYARYRQGIVTERNDSIAEFNSPNTIQNRNEAFNYVRSLEDVFENELNERILTLEDIASLPDEEKTGFYYESMVIFHSTRLGEDINLFNASSYLLEEKEIHWYQIGLVEEMIEISNHLSSSELEDLVIISDFGYVVLRSNIEIVINKTIGFESVWINILR